MENTSNSFSSLVNNIWSNKKHFDKSTVVIGNVQSSKKL